MPPWFEATISIIFAVAAVFFFAKYREAAGSLHESERMKHKLSKDLDRYRDMPQLRALRDGLIGTRNLPVDDEGREHLLIRNGEQKLVHITVHKTVAEVDDSSDVTYRAGGEERRLQELE
ncbi:MULTISPECIES: hypothetical protein [Microbulbifer]|uniref:Uncharacterized protein n=1 Tax=Microbulbifer celer TaxID=435905 RepID=A0ABW3UBG3_9GAMM|nr:MULTISPECIES: hypothetical protein [Microbulbifer]UFN57086.1 hypothetical protein LPW13_16195 [Microbulbifer celer]